MLDKLKKDKNYLSYVAFSDEASAKFDCGRYTIRLFPGESRYNADFQRKLPPGRFSVMCHGTITRDAPLSFFIVDGSINQFSYSVMLAKKVIPKIRERRKHKKRVILMHDNAPSHKTKLVSSLPQEVPSDDSSLSTVVARYESNRECLEHNMGLRWEEVP
ncbi:hypothetical protein RvY_18791 [Ramazzottius varieornatus]|uniref:Tc1-like transposase DDE domain-containing protein n=1 Tax=Ramazzottius varieornatus TaxID=947166 RepID=A0A1D1W7B9_RAMVA|nr:hypothetical protein RvY_18791 [Ramazzottius varieornatus]